MENKIKHLEFIQLAIIRMASNSFFIKGWVITLMAAIFAVNVSAKNSYIPFLNYFIVPIFWILDGYFLSQERMYRSLYNSVRVKEENEIDFSMDASPYNSGKNKWISAIFSVTLIIFYFLLILSSVGILYVINYG